MLIILFVNKQMKLASFVGCAGADFCFLFLGACGLGLGSRWVQEVGARDKVP